MTGEAAEELDGGFSRRALFAIVASVAVSLATVLGLAVRTEKIDRLPPTANSFSYSALGHHAVVRYLERSGVPVISRRSPGGGEIGPTRPLVLAEPAGDSEQLAPLLQEAAKRQAPLVLVLPKWDAGGPSEERPDWLSEVKLRPLPEVVRSTPLTVRRFRKAGRCTSVWQDGPAALSLEEPAQLFAPSPDLQALVSCPGGVLIGFQAETATSPRAYLISDPDLLNNQGLGRADHARIVHQLFTRGLGATGAVFDETVHGLTRTQGLLAVATSFPLGLAVLQGLVLLGLVLWAGVGRFGKPLPATLGLPPGKEVLIDNTAKLLENGGHAADSAVRYFRQVTRAVAAHYFLAPDLPDGERSSRLQQLSAARGVPIDLADLERRLLHLPAGRPGEEQAVRWARRLYDWKVEMMTGEWR